MDLILRMNRRSLSSDPPDPSPSSPSPGPPPGGRLLPLGSFLPPLSLLSLSPLSSLSSGSSPSGSFPPGLGLLPLSSSSLSSFDGATLVGGRVGDRNPVIDDGGSKGTSGTVKPFVPSISQDPDVSGATGAALGIGPAGAKALRGAEIFTSVSTGVTAVAVWTIGIGAGEMAVNNFLICMFMDSVCIC